MKFSVLIANYNNEQFLDECLQSILSQTYKNIEIIVVDDCSTDNSLKSLMNYAQKYSFITVLQNDQNRGAGYTKKKCIDAATGDVCGFVDPDDKLDLKAVEVMIEQHKIYPTASLIYSTNYECDHNLKILRKNGWIKQQPNNISVFQQTYVGHFASFKRLLYYMSAQMTESFKRAVDHDLYCCLDEVGELIYIDKPLYYYRRHNGSISLGANKYKAEFWDWIVKFKHAERRGFNLEDEYVKKMSERLEVDGGLFGRIFKNIYLTYRKFRGL